MSVDQINFLSQNDGVLCEKNNGNLTHLGQNISKLQKSKKVLEKNLDSMTNQVNEANKQLVNMKIDTSKLKKQLEKSEHKRNSLNVVLQKITEELKQKDEIIKKQSNYINKLESQLIKGTLNLDLIETNRKLEEKTSSLEREIKEIQALNEALKTKFSHQEEKLSILNSCIQINLTEHFSNTGTKLSIEDCMKHEDSRNKEFELSSLRQEVDSLRIVNSNQQMEISSYQETLQKSFMENQMMKKTLDDISRNRASEESREYTIREKHEREITELKEEIAGFSGKFNKVFEEKMSLEEEIRKLHDNIREYKELVGSCEEVFSGDFESILKESLGIIEEKKIMKQKIHDIVKDCTEKLLGEEI